MAAKKDSASPIYVCYVCGEVISGDHVYIKTRRGTSLYIHKECIVRGGKK